DGAGAADAGIAPDGDEVIDAVETECLSHLARGERGPAEEGAITGACQVGGRAIPRPPAHQPGRWGDGRGHGAIFQLLDLERQTAPGRTPWPAGAEPPTRVQPTGQLHCVPSALRCFARSRGSSSRHGSRARWVHRTPASTPSVARAPWRRRAARAL